MTNKLKAVILAAGFGKRLEPITKKTPKPLVTFFGCPLISCHIRRLTKHNLQDICINTHHLSDVVESYCHTLETPATIFFSHEREKILGTGGCFGNMEGWRQGADLVVINSDIVTNFSIEKLISCHKEKKAYATMGLLPTPHEGETPIWVEKGFVVSIGGRAPSSKATPHGFSCIQILSNNFLKKIVPNKQSSVVSYYQDCLLREEKVAAYIEESFWCDIGTPKRYYDAHLKSLQVGLSKKEDFFNHLRSLGLPEEILEKVLYFNYDQKWQDSFVKAPSCVVGSVENHQNVTLGPNAIVCGPSRLIPKCTVRESLTLSGFCMLKKFSNVSRKICSNQFCIDFD